MIGSSDAESVPGTANLIDVAKFEESAQLVRSACDQISRRDIDGGQQAQSELLEAATQVIL